MSGGAALLGTWLICASCVAVYIPVHLDIRYLVPLIPLHCLLGADFVAEVGIGRSGRGARRVRSPLVAVRSGRSIGVDALH